MTSFQMPSAAAGGTVSILNNGSSSSSGANASLPPIQTDVNASEPSPSASSSLSTGFSHGHGSRSASGSGSGGGTDSMFNSSSRSSRTSSEATNITRPDSQPSSSRGKVLDGNVFSRSPQPYNSLAPPRPPAPLQPSAGLYPPPRYEDDMVSARASEAPSSTAASTSSHRSNKPRATIVQGGKKRYPCSHPGCDKTFSTSGHAARHNRIHTGQKPYCCTFPGCQASFSRQDNALAHFRTGHALAKNRSVGEDEAADSSGNLAPSSAPSYDAQSDAHAEMGRRALEEGTAIAVVRDGKVERTVGMPRGRASSGSASISRGGRSRYSVAAGNNDVPAGENMDEDDDDDEEDEDMMYADGSKRYSNAGPTPAADYAQSHSGAGAPYGGGPKGTASDAIREHHRLMATHSSPSSVHSDYNSRTLPRPLGHGHPSAAPVGRRAHPYAYTPPTQPRSHHYAGSEGPTSQYDDYPAGPAPASSMSSSSSSPSWNTYRRSSQVGGGGTIPPPPPPPPHYQIGSGLSSSSSSSQYAPPPPASIATSSRSSDSNAPWQPLRLEGLNFNMRGAGSSAPHNPSATASGRKPSLPFSSPSAPLSSSPSLGATSLMRNGYFHAQHSSSSGQHAGAISPGAASVASSGSSSSYLPSAFARPFACSSDRSTTTQDGKYAQPPYATANGFEARRPPSLAGSATSSGKAAGRGEDAPIVLPPLRLPNAPARS